MAGAVLRIDERGALVVERDLIRPADKAKLPALPKAGAGKARAVHSERLCHDLSSQRTAALQAELMEQADVAVVYLTYTLMRQVLERYPGRTLARVSLGGPELAEGAAMAPAAVALSQRIEQWRVRLADVPADGWLAWLSAQPQTAVLELLAFCVAGTLDAIARREGDNAEFAALGQALRLDVGKWWQASAASYFQHVNKERIVAVVTQVLGPVAAAPLESMTKTAAAGAAERLLAGRAWLPELLRVP